MEIQTSLDLLSVQHWHELTLWICALMFISCSKSLWASQVVLVVKHPPANAGDIRDVDSICGLGRSPGGGLGKPAPVYLAWRIPWTAEPGGLQSIGSQRIGHDTNDFAHMHARLRACIQQVIDLIFFTVVILGQYWGCISNGKWWIQL